MLDRLRQSVFRLLRIPAAPQIPDGSKESTLVFRASRNFYYWQVLTWALSNAGLIAGAVAGYYFSARLVRLPALAHELFAALELLALLGIVASMPITFLAVRWNFELRWYIITDRSLRIRRGVWSVEELTMTFANIQEIRVTSGPVQNLLKIADVEVQSAGGGGGGGGTDSGHGRRNTHIATFEGVENANEIRDCIVERLRAYRDLGLGGSSRETGSVMPAAASADSLAAAEAVLQEARALRAAWPPQPNPIRSSL